MLQNLHLDHIISQTLMITIFVMAMMVLIEQINIKTKGIWSERIRQKPVLQIVLGAFLGVIPGCLGAYSIVSLYAHKVVGFAALVSNMIATSGDEAFVMFSLMPDKALLINLLLLLIGIAGGLIVHFASKHKAGKHIESFQHQMHVHAHEEDISSVLKWHQRVAHNLRNITFVRALLLTGSILFLVSIAGNMLSHEHFDIDHLLQQDIDQQIEATHGHDDSHEHHFPWLKITYIIVLGAAFLSFLFASEHFLKDHLWGHILKKHFLKMLLWTFSALLLVAILQSSYHFQSMVDANIWGVLLLAVLLGLIPQSGPHLLFVILFFQGSIPFSILLANSIVQDGHGALPLLAESRRRFFWLKFINLVIGFLVGTVGLVVIR